MESEENVDDVTDDEETIDSGSEGQHVIPSVSRPRPSRQHTDVFCAGGVYTDCEKLLKKFLSLKTSTFEHFVQIWKEMKFSQIFLGRDSYAELLEFTEETLIIAKSFLLPPHSQIKRIGGLYLMYGLYMQQPTRGQFKYRITPQEWSVILKFVENLKIHGFIDANYVFHKMCLEGAFLTVAISREFGLERNYRKYLMPWPDRDLELDPCQTFSLETLMGRVYRGSLKAAADKCLQRYNSVKQSLNAKDTSKFQPVTGTERSLDDIMQENLQTSVDSTGNIIGLLTKSSNIGDERKRIREKAIGTRSLPQNSRSVVFQDTASTSQTNPESHPIEVPVEELSSDDDQDHQFKYIIKPPSMANFRKQKQIKEKVLKKQSGPVARTVQYEEVTGKKTRIRNKGKKSEENPSVLEPGEASSSQSIEEPSLSFEIQEDASEVEQSAIGQSAAEESAEDQPKQRGRRRRPRATQPHDSKQKKLKNQTSSKGNASTSRKKSTKTAPTRRSKKT